MTHEALAGRAHAGRESLESNAEADGVDPHLFFLEQRPEGGRLHLAEAVFAVAEHDDGAVARARLQQRHCLFDGVVEPGAAIGIELVGIGGILQEIAVTGKVLQQHLDIVRETNQVQLLGRTHLVQVGEHGLAQGVGHAVHAAAGVPHQHDAGGWFRHAERAGTWLHQPRDGGG